MSDDSQPITAETYTPRRNVARSIIDVAGHVKEIVDQRASVLGITGAQWVVLIRIASGIGGSASELCRAIGYDSGSMTRMLDRLEKSGLIYRERCAEDRRVVKIFLTPAGKELYPQLAPIAVQNLNQLLKGFKAEEIELLQSMLDRMIANLVDEQH
ncbi:MAG TPA: MarR family transcriptional regulator [Candidatus Sulfotelmatobacter sp.]|nr:MarR family transcriptional regulator [Candidatus Sulfotelmatobacter sp.]